MTKKYNSIKRILLPAKKINIFIISIFILGIISGSIFSNIIGINDQNLVIEKIKLFIDNINTNNLNNIIAFKNSISINLLYITIIWILGMTMVGILFNIFLLFTKGFVIGFSLSSFIITYSYKGIIISFLYLTFGQLLNILTISIISIYSIMFSHKLLNLIIKNKTDNFRTFLKNYILILILVIIISLISSLSESFLLPALIKMIIKLYI